MGVDVVGGAGARRGEAADERGGIGEGQTGGIDAVVVAGGGSDAVDAGPELGHVEVGLEDALLAPEDLDEDGVVGFDNLPEVGAGAPGEAVLGRLLREGAAAAKAGALVTMADEHEAELGKVEAVVAVEGAVLASHDGGGHGWRDALQGRPVDARPSVLVLQVAAQRHRGAADRQEGKGQYLQEAPQHEGRGQVDEEEGQKALHGWTNFF